MKKFIAALALMSAAPAFAAPYLVNFEKNWDFSLSGVNSYYAGGAAQDGTIGPNFGVTFSNVFGLSSDPAFPAYSNAPSPLGIAYVELASPNDRAFMNVGSGVLNTFSLFYSSANAVTNAVRAFSGVNGSGTQLGVFNLSANDSGAYSTWTLATFNYSGLARSFELTALAGAGIDNIRYDTVIPLPAAFPMLVAGLGLMGFVARRQRKAA